MRDRRECNVAEVFDPETGELLRTTCYHGALREWQKPLSPEAIEWLQERFAVTKARLEWFGGQRCVRVPARRPWWER